ncbi:MAG: type II toxin-antitoxin system RelE/ParE family toxin [Myxococcaceae bacterium]|nr:MAG: type II toxin-antitoxin system RelE/ParE family toxin [Myxococcaceae bacterium]
MNPDAVEFTTSARVELDETLEYIAARNPDAATRLRVAIGATLATLAAPHPRVDGPTARLSTGIPCRQRFVHPVTLYYDRAPGLVLVLHVWHHAREPIAR